MEFLKIDDFLRKNNFPSYRSNQIRRAIYRDGVSSFLDISVLPKDLRDKLNSEIKILSFDVMKVLVSKDKKSVKALLELNDGNIIESVLMSAKPGDWSVCVSSQVGCPLGCLFCATGRMGFKRNLMSEEITDQVLFWKQYLKKNIISENISSVVFMGMGEPFLNWEEVRKSLLGLINPELLSFGSRSISISTAGIPEGIEKMAEEFSQMNLAISLHFATDEARNKFMPVNKKNNLESVREAIQKYFKKSNRKIFIEYILLENINDNLEDAQNLIKHLKSIGNQKLLHVNLIRYNSTSDNLKPSSPGVAREFKYYLSRNGISVTIRKSLGSEIQGACGQLAGKGLVSKTKMP
jgi:23S rRNA (adenine2503-C2)-methyltransferase